MSKDETKAVRAGASSKDIRQARVKRLLRRIAVWVVIPTLLGIVYYGCIAAPQYDSVALIRVQAKGAGKARATETDTMLVKEFTESRGMLEHLIREQSFDKHYQEGGDFVSSAASGASTEELYSYFREKIIVQYRSDSKSLKISVRAFSADAANTFLEEILKAAETMTNMTDAPARDARIRLALEQVSSAAEALSSAQTDLSALIPAETVDGASPSPSKEFQAELETVRYKRDVARIVYQKALAAQAKVNADLVREQLYIAIVSPPSKPSGSAHPRRAWGILTVFVLSFVFMGVFSMLGAAFREHARF